MTYPGIGYAGGYPIVTGKPAWRYKPISSFLGGLDASKRPDQLADNQCTKLINVLSRQGKLTNDTGYTEFAQVVVGIPQMEYAFRRQSGSIEYVLVTTKTLYEFNEGVKKWHLLQGTAGTTTTAIAQAGDSVVSVVSTAGFVNGDLIAIDTSDGDQHQTIANISGATFILLTPLPIGKTVNVGSVVSRAVVLTGNLDTQVSACVVASNDWFVFTNGVNIVKRYNGTDCVDVPGLPSGGSIVCKVVAFFNAALFLLNTIEGGVNFPWRARRSDQGDPTEWVLGTAGKDDLLETSSPITAAGLLGPYLIVYRLDSIYRGVFVGSIDINYQFDPMTSIDGCLAPNALVAAETEHFVIGQFNIYRYRGDFSLEEIGGPIYDNVFATKGNLNPSTRQRVFSLRLEELSEIWFMYPDINSDNPNVLLRFNYKTGMWYERRFADPFVGFGYFQSLNIFTWSELIGKWTDQTWQWNSQIIMDNSYATHLMTLVSATTGQVFQYDYSSILDNGTPIQYTVETKDFFIPDTDCRFDMLEMGIQGDDVEVLYSTDEGRSWITLGFVTESKLTKARLFMQFPFQRIRFRWTGNSANFRLDWAAFSYKIESI